MVAPGWISMPVIQRAKMRDKPRQPFKPHAPQTVRQAMNDDGMEARIGRDDLEHRPGGRVTIKHNGDFFFQLCEHNETLNSGFSNKPR